MNELLQPLLQAGLIDIGDSDERLANIEKSISELQEKLKLDNSLLPSYSLVALDPNIADDEKAIVDTETIISTHWKALRAKFSERPIPLIRAVILNALYNLGISDQKTARIVYLTSVNFYPFAKLGKESDVVKKLISDLGELSEESAIEEWSLIEGEPKLKLSPLKLNTIKFEPVKVDLVPLGEGLSTAVNNEVNGHGTQHGGASAWGPHFTEHASKTIAKSIEDSLEKLSTSLNPTSIETPINKFFGEFKKSLDEVLKESFNSIKAVERRSKLLWWKETLYSTSVKDSYRTLDVNIQPVIMAIDLYEQLPEITPVSVDFLLRDTLRMVNSESSDKKTFLELLTSLTQNSNKEQLINYFNNEEHTGRISITTFISLAIHGKLAVTSLKRHTGIDESEMLSFEDLSVFILHDLMAEYLSKP